MMQRAMVTGANRGLGLEYCKGLLSHGWAVNACCRLPDQAGELKALRETAGDQLQIYQLDVTKHESVDHLAAQMGQKPIDLLINNAGTYGPEAAVPGQAYQSVEFMDYEIWRDILEVNVLSLFKVTTRFLGAVASSQRKLIMNLSSDLASIANNTRGQSHAYRTSKAAVNMLTRSLAIEMATQGITVISMAPGWCTTDMGGPEGQVDPKQSIADQMKVIKHLGPADSGRFIDRFGEDVAW